MYRNTSIRLTLLTLALCASLHGISQPLRSLYLLSPLTGPVLDYEEIRRYRVLQVLDLDGRKADSVRIYEIAPAQYEIEVFESGAPVILPAGESVVADLRERIRLVSGNLLNDLKDLENRLEAGSPVLTMITLRSGKLLQVKTLAMTEDHLIVDLPIGAQPLALELIGRLHSSNEPFDPRYTYANPVANRYTLGQSAVPLRQGHGYIQNTMLVFNTLSLGLTDHLTLTFSTELLTPYQKATGSINNSQWLASGLSLKYGTRIAPRWHAAGGAMLVGTVFGQESVPPPYVYGMLTYGGSENHISIRPGVIFGSFFDFRQKITPSLVVGGIKRLGQHVALLTEHGVLLEQIRYSSYVWDRYRIAVSASVRVMNRKWAADLGLTSGTSMAFERMRGELKSSYKDINPWLFPTPHVSVSRAF